MDQLTFIAELTKALAWPVTAVLAVLLLRPVITKLIPLLQRLRYKDIELEFGRKVDQARFLLATAVPEVREELRISPLQEHLLRLAEISPRAAVLEAWRRLELAMIRAAQERRPPRERPVRHFQDALQFLYERDDIPAISAGIIDEMRHLRNQAAHAPEFALDAASAIEYINLARLLTRELEGD